jgi:hypothetical protein
MANFRAANMASVKKNAGLGRSCTVHAATASAKTYKVTPSAKNG